MTLGSLLLLHLMAGMGVAMAVYLSGPSGKPLHRIFVIGSAVLFWPLYLPILLAPDAAQDRPKRKSDAALEQPMDGLAQAIAQADAELESALHSLDGWAEHVLAREKDRLQELRQAWTTQAERIREMDRLLARPDYVNQPAVEPELPADAKLALRCRLSQQVIRQNFDRLSQVRQRTLDDLLGTLAWVRELASMIHLAKFTGAPASRADELVSQIAAAVDGLSALTWLKTSEPDASARVPASDSCAYSSLTRVS